MLVLPNTMASLVMYVWQSRFIALTGDEMPNTGGEIHLEVQSMKGSCALTFTTAKDNSIIVCCLAGVYKLYEEEQNKYCQECLSISTFERAWVACFPHVKFRFDWQL